MILLMICLKLSQNLFQAKLLLPYNGFYSVVVMVWTLACFDTD